MSWSSSLSSFICRLLARTRNRARKLCAERNLLCPGRRLQLERCIRDGRSEVPVGELRPELRLALRLLVSDDDALRRWLVAIGHPNLEIHRVGARREMMGGRAVYSRLLDVSYRAHASLQFSGQLAHQEHRERKAHAEITPK